jgi:hypothetical protein
MVAMTAVRVGVVVTGNVAVVAPARTVTVAGTVAVVLLEVRATVKPPVGAGPLIVTVAVEPLPLTTEVGASEMADATGGLTVRVAVCGVAVPMTPVIVSDLAAVTAVVLAVNVAVDAPARTVTVAGTVADESLDVRLTVVPAVGAGPVRVTVPVEEVPPVTVAGFRLTPLSVAAWTVRVTVWLLPAKVPVIVTAVFAATAVVVAFAPLLVWPAPTVIDAGTVVLGSLEVRATVVPPAGAGFASVTMISDGLPPITADFVRLILKLLAALTVNDADWAMVFAVPVMFPVESVAVVFVVTVKVCVVAPAGIVTVAGTVALALADVMATGKPPVGAGLLIVKVPVEGAGPTTVVGFRLTDTSVGAVIVSVALPDWPLADAPIAEVVFAPTATVVTGKVVDDVPPGTVTVAGTVADVLPEVRATDCPALAAGPLSVTVAVDGFPPTTDAGFSVTPVTTGGLTVRVAVCDTVPVLPVTVTVVADATPTVVAVNVAVVAPARTVTVGGTVVDGSLDERVTDVPAVGAGPFRVTVPADEVPPVTEVGFRLTPLIVAAWTVRVTVWVLPANVPVIVTGVFVATAVVVAFAPLLVEPAPTVIDAGTVVLGSLEVRATVVPPAGAGFASVTTISDELPPRTADFVRLSWKVLAASTVSEADWAIVFAVPVMLPVTFVFVFVVVTVKVVDVDPAGIVTIAGTVALALADVIATPKPPNWAGLLIVNVPVEGAGPTTAVGVRLTETSVGAVIVNVALPDWPLADAPIAEVVLAPTATVVTGKVVDVVPAGTVTVAGTVADALPEVRATDCPPVGAGPLIVTVANEGFPPTTDVGTSVTPVTTAGLTVRVAVPFTAPVVAVMVSVLTAATAVVDTVNPMVEVPWGIVKDAGTDADGSLEANPTDMPPAGAAPVRVTEPAEEVAPVTDVGFTTTALTVGAWTVRMIVLVAPARVAVMVTGVLAATGTVVALAPLLTLPAPMPKVAGTVTLGSLELSAMLTPPAGAGFASVTMSSDEFPPTTPDFVRVNFKVLAALTVNGPEAVEPFAVPVIFPVVSVAVVFVVAVNVVDVVPAGIVTVAGTVALALAEVNATG